jgi:hypothetical protein
MHCRFLTLLLVLSAALLSPAAAGGKPDKKASVSFHIQGDATENPRMIFAQEMNGKAMNFRRVPEVGTKDIASYTPFPSAGGGDFGAVFRLKRSAASRLSAISNASQGRWLAAMVNGRIVDGVILDKQIDDGVMVIWKGITLEDIAVLDETLTRTGAEGEKKKKN